MKHHVNTDPHSRITLQGHDPVAFHTAGKALKGDAFVQATYDGDTYLFASEDNRAAFVADPERYLPAYGGYCAYGVANALLFPIEIDTWQIIDDRLTLQFSQDVKAKFDADQRGNVNKANENWPTLGAASV